MAGNSPFNSSSGISALLRGSQARAQKLADLQNNEIDFEWQQSAKTAEDYQAYSDYLNKSLGTTSDPAAQLAISRRLASAQSGYTSNEIQRQTINVIEGGGSNYDKYNKMQDLYYQAANAGHYDLAQNLHLQLDNLSVQIQNEEESAARAGSRGGGGGGSGSGSNGAMVDAQLKDNLDIIKGDIHQTIQQYSQLGPSVFNKRLKAAGVDGDFFGLIFNAVNSMLDQYKQAADSTDNPTDLRNYQRAINDIIGQDENGNQLEPTAIAKLPGAGPVTYQDLVENVNAARTGQALFVATADGKFKRQAVSGYSKGRDENGNYINVPIYGVDDRNSKNFEVNLQGKNQKLNYSDLINTYKNMLNDKGNGFKNVAANDQGLSVTNNGEFNDLGIEQGANVELYIDRQGNLQVKNGDQTYSLQFDPKTGKYLKANLQTPNPITLLGDQLSAPYVGTLDQSRLNAGTIGVIDANSRFSRAVQPGTVLGEAASVRQQLQAESQARLVALQKAMPAPQAAPSILQPANFNPMSSPARGISLAAPKPLPNISLAPPARLPNLTVNNKPNTQSISVNNKPNTQTIRF